MKKSRFALFQSVIALLLCVSMLAGTTFAWFTDSVSSGTNTIAAGNLDIELEYRDANGTWHEVDESTAVLNNEAKWEPGHTEVAYLRISNAGNLALKYGFGVGVLEETGSINVNGEPFYLSEHIRFGIITSKSLVTYGTREEARNALTASQLISQGEISDDDTLKAADKERYVTLVVYMPEEIGNVANHATGVTPPEIKLGIQLTATQAEYESDSFDKDYDKNATLAGFNFPAKRFDVTTSAGVTTDESNKVADEVILEDDKTSAKIPEGVLLDNGTKVLTLEVSTMEQSGANIVLKENEDSISLDVHVEGVSKDNTQPMEITIQEVAPKGLNMGNYKFYHVENGITNEMTLVASDAAFSAHNQYKYDPGTGNITLYMATFSEVALVADTENAWEGNVATAFSGGSGEETDPYLIANADQFVYFGDLISNDNVNYGSKHYKLIANINLGGEENANKGIIFYPVGYHKVGGAIATVNVDDAPEFIYQEEDPDYARSSVNAVDEEGATNWYTYGGAFQGTFDGNGHTIANIYQNTWQMKGDYCGESHYWNAAMGLFGYVNGGTVKNLTVDNFSSDGEFTPTGVIAAYAVNSTFENIAITNCNPRVYNTGNGGIVGIGGNTSDTEDKNLTFTNITIDNTNKISALWGSWDVACGGLVGMFRGAGHVYMTNCHVAAQIDVYNDVCGNYQYYWYRYAGMMVGTNKNMITDKDGYTVPETSKFHAENCTVHFGTWNDYYYCELVANSLASYTHDHQFSRLTQIQNVSEIQDANGNWKQTGNFILMNGKTPTDTCYHIVNKNGTLVQHNHADAGKETVNGETVLKENNQRIFLPFNQLFTGYGWGVKHVPIYDDGNTYFEGITILKRDVADSVDKFRAKVDNGYTVSAATEIKIGDLFQAIEGADIVKENVQVFVSPVDTSNMILGVYAADTESWENGILKFHGNGEAKVTITDYTYCNPCSVVVKVVGNSVLYRVGTEGDVTYSQIARLLTGNDQNSSVEMVKLEDADYGASFVDKKADENVDFATTGIVGVKVNNVPYFLEVVDAKNITTAENAKDNNVVLLNNITASSIEISNGRSFYGNGYEIKFDGDGSYRSAAVSYGFVTMDGGTLDNARVICKIFPKAYLFATEMSAGSDGRYPYGYSAIIVSGNSTISNSYIYGARNNIQVGAGNIKIQNTVTENGSLSNIHILSGSGNTVTLDNLTTIQRQVKDDFGAGNTMLGFGVLVGTNETETYPTIKITGNLKQYNWVSKADASEVSNTYAEQAINSAVTNTNYVHKLDGVDKINLGIVFLTTIKPDIQDKRTNSVDVPYLLSEVSIATYKGQVYSVKAGSAITDNSGHNAEKDGVIPYVPNAQNATRPQVTHSGVNGSSLTIKTEFNKEWITTFTADLDNITGGNYTFKFSDLVVKKYGKELSFTIKDKSGNQVDKNTEITLNQLKTSEYTLVVTDNVIHNGNGQLSGETVTHEMPFVLYATKTSIEPPKFTGIGSGVSKAIRLVSSSGGNWRPAYPALEGVSVEYWSASQGKMATVDLSTLTDKGTSSGQKWTYTCDDYTLTITGGPVHTTTSYVLSPMIATRDGNKILYFAGANKDNSTGTTARLICLEYVFTDKNASTTVGQCTKYADGIATVQYANLPEFSWSSFQKGTVEAVSSGSSSGCVTPDTLITLADGSQVRVDSLKGDEQLLVWNLETGKYDTAPIVFVDSDQESEYEIIHLYFSDGSDVKVIYEHGFFDLDLGKYVYIDANNYGDYIGHRFVTEGDIKSNNWNVVTLDEVVIETEVTTAWSPVTFEHLCYYTNGVLSMPGGIEGLFNIFEVDTDLMRYDAVKMQKDIETFGLFTIEDFGGMITEEAFNAFNGAYLKVAIAKGILTWEDIAYMAERYIPLMK